MIFTDGRNVKFFSSKKVISLQISLKMLLPFLSFSLDIFKIEFVYTNVFILLSCV